MAQAQPWVRHALAPAAAYASDMQATGARSTPRFGKVQRTGLMRHQ